jgi:hypothetical protein
MKSTLRWAGIFFLPVLLLVLAPFLGIPISVASALTTHSAIHVTIVGATIGANVLTLTDWAKRLDPGGKGVISDIVEMLGQTNEILDDMLWKEGNLVTGERTTVRTGLPSVAWRIINQGVTPSKSTTAQIDEATGMLEAWSEVDKELAKLSGDVNAFRLSEAGAFIEAMNQTMATTLFYGNSALNPEQFTGLSVRYSSLTALNSKNIVGGGGVGADNTSMWLVVWGAGTVFGVFPNGSEAGLQHEDLGEETAETTAGLGGTRMRVLRDMWQWKCGLVLKDWRYVVRAPNIDVSDLVANAGAAAKLFFILTKMTWRIPAMAKGRAVIYVNRTVGEFLDIQAQSLVSTGGQLSYTDYQGRRVMSFRGIPIKISDAILETEAQVT